MSHSFLTSSVLCQFATGAYLEQGWPVFLIIYALCFIGALLDQGVIGTQQLLGRMEVLLLLRRLVAYDFGPCFSYLTYEAAPRLRQAREKELNAEQRQKTWEEFVVKGFAESSWPSIWHALCAFAQGRLVCPCQVRW